MTTRRTLIKGAAATVLLAPTARAHTLAAPALPHPGGSLLEALMLKELARNLGSEATARQLVPSLLDAIFDWTYPVMPVADASAVIAFSFGNRPAEGKTGAGDQPVPMDMTIPGPVNARLADAVHAIRLIRDIPVYAQWEIAQVLEEKYGMDRVVSIKPEKAPDGSVVYLSTEGVAKAAVLHAGSTQGLRRVAVVGHRDHVKRCILVSRGNGLSQAAAAHGIGLPVEYDALSGQAWTRSRDLYVLSDMTARMGMIRARLLAELAQS